MIAGKEVLTQAVNKNLRSSQTTFCQHHSERTMTMDTRTVIALLVTTAALATCTGCATGTADFRGAYNNSLHAALAELENGQTSAAATNLDAARAMAEEHGYDTTLIERLAVEVNLGMGDTVAAFDQAKTLLDTDPQDPYAHELLGKCLLRDGEFKEAEDHFIAAHQAYQAPDDVARAQDFLAVTHYFLAYADGNLRLAEGYLREVQDPDLLRSIDQARKDVELNPAS